ncbi:MAG TPA: amidase family protein [Burkholderiales bacterium]|nr:amidase family protein [Burkholderiales bacterium]
MGADNDLIRLTATEAVARLRRREISPLELIDAAAARIEAVDGKVNALPIRFIDAARATARRFMAQKPPQDPPPGWLAGLPIAAKDYNDVAGQRTTFGSPIFADAVARTNDHTVATLEASGAIFMAKSNVPEFAGANTFNPVFGATRNPWNLKRTAGGSSGGAAAALASGMQWLAMGSDLGGSLRIPASYCSIVGLRPSVGRAPRGAGLPAFDSLWVEGPMARNVPDLALMLDALSVQHPDDPLAMPPPRMPFTSAVRQPVLPRRVAFTSNLGLSSVDPEVVAICAAAAQRFTPLGTSVEEASPDFSNAIDTFQTLRGLLFAALRGELLPAERSRINPAIVWNIEKGLKLTADEIIRAERERSALYHRVATFFDKFDLLLCPTVSVPPYPVEQPYPTRIGDQQLTSYIDWMFLTFVVTLTGCPALSLPCGFTRDGLPVGLQIIGRSHADAAVIAAASLLEREFGIAYRLPIDPLPG